MENNKTHILCQLTFPENRAVYELMLKNMVEPERFQMKIWRLRVACRISKATRAQAHARARTPTFTHTQHVILVAFSRQQWFCERALLLRHTNIASLLVV
jgi:hypothetical protein